jgi:hypothetical protein
MGRYRSWAERRDIIRAIVADSNPPALETFQLSPSEEVFFRARSARAVDRLARKTSGFKAYYKMPTRRPFGYIVGMSALIVIGALMAAAYLWLHHHRGSEFYPLFAAIATLSVAATGWCVAGWITHRNTIRQNTNNMLFARFAQSTFGDAVHRFHTTFGSNPTERVTPDRLSQLRATDDEEARKAVASVAYLLNYYEFIASGVINGDLHADIIRDNIRGVICFYYDKCEPHITALSRQNHCVFANLIKIRTSYREP